MTLEHTVPEGGAEGQVRAGTNDELYGIAMAVTREKWPEAVGPNPKVYAKLRKVFVWPNGKCYAIGDTPVPQPQPGTKVVPEQYRVIRFILDAFEETKDRGGLRGGLRAKPKWMEQMEAALPQGDHA